MRYAIDSSGAQVAAQAGAPLLAKCPDCGGFVILRRRRSGYPRQITTYFWRHEDNAHLDCPNRPSAASAMRA